MCRGTEDVLLHLDLASRSSRAATEVPRQDLPAGVGGEVLDALGWQPSTLEQLATRTSRDLEELAGALDELTSNGWVEVRGGWYERRVR
jgi:predicted Rossmann fold nucleotide-binding protein DprA/Smf involved in DNA uptake